MFLPPTPPPPVLPTPFPMSSLTYFTPPAGTMQALSIQHMFDLPLDFHSLFVLAGQTTIMFAQIAGPSFLFYYIGIRIGMMAFLWMAGFVMQKIGKKIPDINTSSSVAIVRDIASQGMYEYGRRTMGLPRLPSSGISRGGRRGRGTWP